MKPYWSKKWGKDKICGITHSRLRPGKNKRGISYTIKLNCNHSFYRSVLLEWVKSFINKGDPTCPLCRVPFKFKPHYS
jgi:hypothetical protein